MGRTGRCWGDLEGVEIGGGPRVGLPRCRGILNRLWLQEGSSRRTEHRPVHRWCLAHTYKAPRADLSLSSSRCCRHTHIGVDHSLPRPPSFLKAVVQPKDCFISSLILYPPPPRTRLSSSFSSSSSFVITLELRSTTQKAYDTLKLGYRYTILSSTRHY